MALEGGDRKRRKGQQREKRGNERKRERKEREIAWGEELG